MSPRCQRGVCFDELQLPAIRAEMIRRREILVRLAKDPSAPMDKLDRQDIVLYLDQGAIPRRPESVPGLMKAFVKSCLTYSVLRRFCVSLLGEIPTPDTIGECLARVFCCQAFRVEQTWTPEGLRTAAEHIQAQAEYDLDSKIPRPRITRVLLDGSKEMHRRLARGMAGFYESVDQAVGRGPDVMWSWVLEFSQGIRNVGPALTCDFLKEIGYAQFVKVDHHFTNEFPSLIKANCEQLSSREHFVFSQRLARWIGMTPYHLDRILYEWGRCKSLVK